MSETLSIVLFSGTDDKLTAASTLAAGAAALGKRVDIFLQFWGLDAFRKDRIAKDHGVAAEAGPEGAEALRKMNEKGQQHWSEVLRQVRDIGDIGIFACAHSMEMFELTTDDLDPMVDDVMGIAAFTIQATGQMVFI